MNRNEARQEIRNNWRIIIKGMTGVAKQKANHEESYICPFCGHGSHGDGITFNPKSRDGNNLKCFTCGFYGDIIDIYMKHENVTYNKALFLLAGQLGLTIDSYNSYSNTITNDSTAKPVENKKEEDFLHDEMDYTEYYRECAARIDDSCALAYLKQRGISRDTAKFFSIGFDPKADPAQSGIYTAPRIIVPITPSYYVTRTTDEKTPVNYRKLNSKSSKVDVFNVNVLYESGVKEIFVTEGVFDALSLIEIGADALSLNSTSNVGILLEHLRQKKTEATLIVSLDNDGPGKSAKENLIRGLKELGISFTVADIYGEYKDANEYLQNDRDGFSKMVGDIQNHDATKPNNVRHYINDLMAQEIEKFQSNVMTGYSNLDEMSGGLYEGLYVIAAVPTLGKTTFAHQMGDQIAAGGHDVLYFSLEQSCLELVSKSLARTISQEKLGETVTSLAIRKGCVTPEVVSSAKEIYLKRVSDRMNIIEGNFNCNISSIGNSIERFKEENDSSPVVIIDYLQILQPRRVNNRQQTTKEMIDLTVTELKRLSRELGITIIVISSLNRSNYNSYVDYESLKESGSIEYTADVIWGLQYQCVTKFDKEKAAERRKKVQEEKNKEERTIDLICLKNRYGKANFTCSFKYSPQNDLFEVIEEDKHEKKTIQRI